MTETLPLDAGLDEIRAAIVAAQERAHAGLADPDNLSALVHGRLQLIRKMAESIGIPASELHPQMQAWTGDAFGGKYVTIVQVSSYDGIRVRRGKVSEPNSNGVLTLHLRSQDVV